MNKFILIILICGMNLFAQRFIELNYTKGKISFREIQQKYVMRIFTSDPGILIKWKAININYEKEISKEIFEDIFNGLLKLNTQEIIKNNDHVLCRSGKFCTLTFGNDANKIELRIWSPDTNTENRKLSEYLKLVTKIIELSGLNSDICNGKVPIYSLPPHAEIYQGKKLIGETNSGEIELPCGEYNLQFKIKGETIKKIVTINPGKNKQILILFR